MYRKKLTYSFFTIPVALVSFSLHDWHRRRMVEKVIQVNNRTNNVIEDAVDIQNLYNASNSNRFPWIGLNTKQLNENFGFKPIELNGEFDHSKQIFVERIRQGEEGFDVITPFYCYRDEFNNLQPVLVNRGWIPFDNKRSNLHLENAGGNLSIKGFVYKGDTGHKYSKNNDIAGGKWYTQKPDEIASFLYLPNRQFSSQFMLRQVEFNPINKSTTPVILNVSELGHFPVSSETNGNYSEMWRAFTFLNIFSNLLVWVYY
jgi:cytochrome oxidase assembly protein ShyY1